MDLDSRQKAKVLQAKFLQTAESSLEKFSNELQHILIKSILTCPTKQCFEQKKKYLNELNKQANGLLTFLGGQMQQCISREYNYQGIEGYNKCFTMFEKVIDWETRKPFIEDENMKKGMKENIKSKEYHKVKKQWDQKMKEI